MEYTEWSPSNRDTESCGEVVEPSRRALIDANMGIAGPMLYPELS